MNAGQLEHWRGEIVAQAGIDAEDDDLDETVNDIDHAIYSIDRDYSSRHRRYFTKPRHQIVRLGLESEIKVVRAWPASLAGEPEEQLQSLGKQLAGDIEEGNAAVAVKEGAAGATKDHRVREIEAYIEKVNKARRTIYGELIKRGEANGRRKGWAERFFRKSTSAKPTKADAPVEEQTPAEPTPA